MSKQNPPFLQTGLVILGLIAWAIAGLMYGNSMDYHEVVLGDAARWKSPAAAVAPNTKAGLGTLGFAIAGGLCLLGAAVAELARRPARDNAFRAEPYATADRPRD